MGSGRQAAAKLTTPETMNAPIAYHSRDPRVPKIIGFDTELMNVDPARDDSGVSASRALLREIHGFPANNGMLCEQDSARIYLPGSGASFYIDLDHLEMAGPECRSARDFLKCFHGMLGIARQAARHANDGRSPALRVHANNSDGHGNSWGGHMSVMVSRTAYHWIFQQRLHYLLWLASAQASSIILTGAGKVGTERGRPAVPYQISQRADFFECLRSLDTTCRRPLVNTRDETLAGAGLARLHCIFHDTTLCHTSLLLRAGLMQVFLAMIEAQTIDSQLCFEEPLAAMHAFSADPSLHAVARLLDGRRVTALEHQLLLCEHARAVLDDDSRSHIPGLPEIMETWTRTLAAFQDNDRTYLARHIDWVAKLMVLERAASSHALDFSAPPMKALDLAWSDLENGIYYAFERSGAVDRLAGDQEIADAADEAPDDTRAYPRSRLIRAFGGRKDVMIDWHQVVVARRIGKRLVVRLPDPAAGKQVVGDLDSLSDLELIDHLGTAVEPDVWRWNAAAPITSSTRTGYNYQEYHYQGTAGQTPGQQNPTYQKHTYE